MGLTPNLRSLCTVLVPLFALAGLISPLAAQDISGYERILIPFHGADLSGVDGSRFSVTGSSISTERLLYWPDCFGSAEPQVGILDPDGSNRSLTICRSGTMGRILYVERDNIDSLSLGFVLASRAADPDADEYHVSIPLAREADFRQELFHIVVPYGTGRNWLRVYEMNGNTYAAVRVRTRVSILGWTYEFEEIITLASREGTDPSYPAFAQLPLELSCFITSPRVCAEWDAAIEIEPLTPGDYWAVVSRTSDVTQQVTLYWPQ
jgi:hypothetical protein